MLMIGHDAEVFVNDGMCITSIIGKLGGTKDNPLPVKHGALQEDNVLAELNIDPCTTADEFVTRTAAVLAQLEDRLPSGWGVDIISSHHYEQEALMSFGDKAMEFGCTPDFNCWTLEQNQISSPFTTLRTAGGHVHIGFDDVTPETQLQVMRMADYMLGLPSVILDTDKQRRELYGKSGAYRPKKYGAEYRVLSNFWLKDEAVMRWVFSQAQRCYNERGNLDGYTSIITPPELAHIINTGDESRAKSALRDLGITLP